MSPEELTWLAKLSKEFGPTVAILLALVVGCGAFIVMLLRRESRWERERGDELARTERGRADEYRNDRDVLVRTIQECTAAHRESSVVSSELRRTLDRLAEAIGEQERQRARDYAEIIRAMREVPAIRRDP